MNTPRATEVTAFISEWMRNDEALYNLGVPFARRGDLDGLKEFVREMLAGQGVFAERFRNAYGLGRGRG